VKIPLKISITWPVRNPGTGQVNPKLTSFVSLQNAINNFLDSYTPSQYVITTYEVMKFSSNVTLEGGFYIISVMD